MKRNDMEVKKRLLFEVRRRILRILGTICWFVRSLNLAKRENEREEEVRELVLPKASCQASCWAFRLRATSSSSRMLIVHLASQ